MAARPIAGVLTLVASLCLSQAARAGEPPVPVRTESRPGFGRVAFDFAAPVRFRIERTGDTVAVVFTSGRAVGRASAFAAQRHAVAGGAGRAEIAVAAGAQIRAGRAEKPIVIDVLDPSPGAAQASPPPPKTEPPPAGKPAAAAPPSRHRRTLRRRPRRPRLLRQGLSRSPRRSRPRRTAGRSPCRSRPMSGPLRSGSAMRESSCSTSAGRSTSPPCAARRRLPGASVQLLPGATVLRIPLPAGDRACAHARAGGAGRSRRRAPSRPRSRSGSPTGRCSLRRRSPGGW